MAAKIFRINYKSDFILTLESDAGWMTPFCIKFWTGAPSRAYYAGWDGTTYTHCSYDPAEPTKLVVQFDDHHLPIGDLKLQIAYHFTVADFPNDTEDEVINPANITTEIDGQEYQVMLDFTGETAPEIQFSLPAYANEAQRIANEQEREQKFAEMQEENAQAVEGAENVNATLNGNILTVTNRNGQSTSVNTKGEAGHGVPAGGLTGQMLFKKSDADYDTDWQDPHAAGVNSVNGKTGDVTLNASDVGALPIDTPIPTVPNNVSAFNNDAGYVTKTVNDLVNYYLKSETYTKSEVQGLIAAIQQFHYEIYASISAVTSPAGNVLYLIGPTGTGSDKYEEYVYDATKQEPWVKIGDTSIDLSDYYTKGQTDSAITSALNTALADYTTTAALTLLLAGKQDVINDISDIRSGAAAGATAYQKPAGGIPKTDLAQGVKDSLDKADTALQEDTLYEDANGHDYVEIGGMKWATKNIGANAVTDAGLYFQWGDTQGYTAEEVGTGEGKKAFAWADYKFSSDAQGSSMTKYNSTDGKTVLELEDDAARANWGGTWRMPTKEEMQAFGAAVNAVWTDNYQGSGVAGLVCTDKTDNTKVVFFPAAGSCYDGSMGYVGSSGQYWSSSLYSGKTYAYLMGFGSSLVNWQGFNKRCRGQAVRGILDTTQLKKDLDSKADKVPNATNGNFAGLDANGNITDSGSKASDFATTQQLPTVMGASGSGHKGGLVPDTPSTAGTTKFLREDGTWEAPPAAPVTSVNGQTGAVVLSIPDVSTKEDVTTIVAPVNQTDATLPITTLTAEVGKYYRIDVAVDTLAVTLPAMENITTTKTVVLYLTGGTTPAVTISSTAPTNGTAPDVYFSNGYAIEAGKTYEVNCLWNGSAWIVASVKINTSNS